MRTKLENISRRKLLSRLTGGVLGLGAVAAAWPYIRSLFPNIYYEPAQRFKIGKPENFSQGVVFLDKHRIYLFKEGNAFHVISGVCSHLGCTVKYSPHKQKKELTVRSLQITSAGEFHCPCHGSKFHEEGTNYTGPAPKPLKWHPVTLSPEDGQLVVDLSKEVNRDFRLVV